MVSVAVLEFGKLLPALVGTVYVCVAPVPILYVASVAEPILYRIVVDDPEMTLFSVVLIAVLPSVAVLTFADGTLPSNS